MIVHSFKSPFTQTYHATRDDAMVNIRFLRFRDPVLVGPVAIASSGRGVYRSLREAQLSHRPLARAVGATRRSAVSSAEGPPNNNKAADIPPEPRAGNGRHKSVRVSFWDAHCERTPTRGRALNPENPVWKNERSAVELARRRDRVGCPPRRAHSRSVSTNRERANVQVVLRCAPVIAMIGLGNALR